MKVLFGLTLIILLSNAIAFAKEGTEQSNDRRPAAASDGEVVKWVGEISDSPLDHTTLHNHQLMFKNRDTGRSYRIVDSPELVKIHHDNEKNYLVEIEAEKTTRFLFWGGNLIVKNFKILGETASVPHLAPTQTANHEFRGSNRP